jgi:hypothetical protein
VVDVTKKKFTRPATAVGFNPNIRDSSQDLPEMPDNETEEMPMGVQQVHCRSFSG